MLGSFHPGVPYPSGGASTIPECLRFPGHQNCPIFADALHQWIAFSDESQVSVAVWTGSDWRMELLVEAGRLALGQLVSLKLDGEGRPHMTYFEVTGESPLTGLVKYATGTPK